MHGVTGVDAEHLRGGLGNPPSARGGTAFQPYEVTSEPGARGEPDERSLCASGGAELRRALVVCEQQHVAEPGDPARGVAQQPFPVADPICRDGPHRAGVQTRE